jgi:hypothetical protein
VIAPDLWRSLELVGAVEAETVASIGSAVRGCHGDVKLGFCVAAERVDRMRPYVWATKRVGCVVPGDCPQSHRWSSGFVRGLLLSFSYGSASVNAPKARRRRIGRET